MEIACCMGCCFGWCHLHIQSVEHSQESAGECSGKASAICNRSDSEARIVTGAIEMGNRSGERTDAKKRVKCKDNPCNLYRGETRMRAIPSIYVEFSP